VTRKLVEGAQIPY